MSNTTSLPLPFSPESTVGELVAARPALARIFERVGIDYCCGGRQTLAVACARAGLDTGTVRALLDSWVATTADGPAVVDAAALTLTALADHIEVTHHAYLKAELPRLVELAQRVSAKHGWRDGRLAELAVAVRTLAQEMAEHMGKEEQILFPLVRQIDAGAAAGPAGLAGPIVQMEAEHQAAGDLTASMRLLTDGFTPAPDACNSHRALLAGLAEFEADLHLHVHKENNVLFPRALARAAG